METAITKTAVLFDPYLDTLGGGERYVLTIADILSKNGWQVVLAWNDLGIIKLAQDRFALELENIQIDPEYYNLFSKKSSLPSRHRALKDMDLVFVVSDGSVPILFGKNTILHYQVPFTQINLPQIVNKIKLITTKKIVVNSNFTKKVIDKTLDTNRCKVLYPPVDVESFVTDLKKNKTILNVGRFASPSHSKRQDVLISAFMDLCDKGLKNWKLILAGGKFGNDSVLDDLRNLAKGYPVEFIVNPNFTELKDLYSRSTLYWHAAGFEVDEKLNPEAVEHFGITTVEAMASGCVPLVIDKGGQKEIVTEKEGYLWQTIDQLVEYTNKLIKQPKKIARMSKNSIIKSKQFGIDNFTTNFFKLLS